MIVMKFGGSSVKNAEAVDRVSGIIQARVAQRPVVVVSATGDTTDELVEILDLLEAGQPGAADIAARIAQSHAELVAEVVTDAQEQEKAREKISAEIARLNDMISAMERLGDVSMRSRDAVLSVGERMSAPILAGSLASRGIDAVYVDPSDVMATDDAYGAAVPDMGLTEQQSLAVIVPLGEQGKVPVIGGYVGRSAKGAITTLGRGGSDLTASVIAKSIAAEALEFWKDVDGILSADPRIVPEATPLAAITFREAQELPFLGSGVLHPASIQPAVEAGIPVRVRNSYRPESPGTEIRKFKPSGMIIDANGGEAGKAVASITCKRRQVLVNLYSTRMIGASGFLRRVFEVFDRLKISVDHIATSEVNITVTLKDTDKLAQLQAELTETAKVDVVRDVGVVSVVGELLSATSGVAAHIFSALKDFNILFITHGGASTNVSMVVRDRDVEAAIRSLHQQLFH